MLECYCIIGPEVKDLEKPKIVTRKAQTPPEVISLGLLQAERDHFRRGLGFAGHDLRLLQVLNLRANYTIALQHPTSILTITGARFEKPPQMPQKRSTPLSAA